MTSEDEDGYTLIEMLVVIGLLAVVGTLVTNMMINGLKQQTQITDRITSVNDLRTVMERVTREVRNSTTRLAATDTSLSLKTVTGTGTRYLTYGLRSLTGGTALILDETDVSTAGTSTVLPTKVVLANVPASAVHPFTYTSQDSFTPPAGVSVNPMTCLITGSIPAAYSPKCIGTVQVTLDTQIKHGTAVLELTDVVELRNVTS